MKDANAVLLTRLVDLAATEAGLREAVNRFLADPNAGAPSVVRDLFTRIGRAADAHHARLQAVIRPAAARARPDQPPARSARRMADDLGEHLVSTLLRDLHAELNFAATALSMLHTTALGLDNAEVAEIAFEALRDYTGLILDLGHLLPEMVLWDLAKNGCSVNMNVLAQAQQDYREAWMHPGDADTGF